MAIYEVFSRPISIKYKASLCSNTTCFIVITTSLKFIVPFLLTYYSQGFWHKIDFYQEQPIISFKHKMLIVLETNTPDELIFWSTYKKINSVLQKKFVQVLPEIEHREEDFNKDGKKDELHMSIHVPLSQQNVASVKMLLIFDCKLNLHSDFQMESLAYIYHSSSLPGAEFHVIGDLVIFQREPLSHNGKNEKFNLPVIEDSEIELSSDLENILFEYTKRNITTMLLNSHPIWKTGRAQNKSFVIKILIKYPPSTILYKVGFWQLLKWALVQYMAVFILFSFIIHLIRSCVFQKQLLSTIIVNPVKQKV